MDQSHRVNKWNRRKLIVQRNTGKIRLKTTSTTISKVKKEQSYSERPILLDNKMAHSLETNSDVSSHKWQYHQPYLLYFEMKVQNEERAQVKTPANKSRYSIQILTSHTNLLLRKSIKGKPKRGSDFAAVNINPKWTN